MSNHSFPPLVRKLRLWIQKLHIMCWVIGHIAYIVQIYRKRSLSLNKKLAENLYRSMQPRDHLPTESFILQNFKYEFEPESLNISLLWKMLSYRFVLILCIHKHCNWGVFVIKQLSHHWQYQIHIFTFLRMLAQLLRLIFDHFFQ